MRSDVDHRPDLRVGTALVGVIIGSCAGLVAWGRSIADRLPDPIARHWGAAGVADGFSSLNTTLGVAVGIVLLVSTPLAAAAVLSRQPSLMRRFMAGTGAWLAVFVTVLVADSLRVQLDLSDAAQAPVPGLGIAVGVVGGLVAGTVVAALVRPDRGRALATGPPPASAPRAIDSARSWRGRPAGLDRAAVVLACVVAAGMAVLAAVLTWWLLFVAAFVTGLILSSGRVLATVDGDGLTVTMLGWTAVHVPLAEVAEADVVDVDPFWEFGGWGLRVDLEGRIGVVTRRGPALRVHKADRREVLVSLDDPDRAAGLLNTLADDLHGRS